MKELDRLAKENAPMPSGLAIHEQCYYISSRGLYQQYDAKALSLQQAKTEKAQIIEQYERGEAEWKLFASLFEIQEKLNALKSQGFNTVLELEILELLDKVL